MKLNLAKCMFSITTMKFLSFLVSKNGIEPNHENLKALANMSLPRTLKEVQVLMGQIAALSRFILKMANKCLLFFKSLCNRIDFVWKEQCQENFEDLKRYLGSLKLLTKPNPRDILFFVSGSLTIGDQCSHGEGRKG